MSSSPPTAPGAPGACRIEVAPAPAGMIVRVVGRGTARQSRVVHDAVARSLKADGARELTIDLAACDYLDSTFLGCLVQMHRAATAAGATLAVALPTDRRPRLFGSMRLDRILQCVEAAPDAAGPGIELQTPPPDHGPNESARHVMECHRQLAALDSPMRDAFRRIAEEIERELSRA